MKILAIRGKNIASLEGEFEVDFTQEPLRSAPLFAITGPTGAGKTTLLDTLCLALFEDTPRIGKVKDSARIVDVNENFIGLTDVRCNLRRGCADGYAQADFEALDGMPYRATWLVRRARNKSTGALQNSEHRLVNLQTNTEIQGTKTEILSQIKMLLGLSFEQFTRTVLLAQGDFANFLKADKNEKAELLEKLTGTDIYSKISKKIYENCKNEEAKWKLLYEEQLRIERNLLDEEEKNELTAQLKNLKTEIGELEKQEQQCAKKLEWLKNDETLLFSLKNAENTLKSAKNAVFDAKSRFITLEKIEKSLEIKDTCTQATELFQKQTTEKQEISEKQHFLDEKQQLLTKSAQEITSFEDEEKLFNEENKQIKSQIEQAKILDDRLNQAIKQIEEVEKTISAQEQDQRRLQNKQKTLTNALENDKKQRAEVEKWVRQYANFSDIINDKGLIINLLEISTESIKTIQQQQQSFETNKALLAASESELAELRKTAAELEQILTTEVLTLRARLKPQEPCPVCGSLQHPISEENAVFDTKMSENQWKESKLKNQQAIDLLQAKIDELRLQIHADETQTVRLSAQINKNLTRLDTIFSAPLPQWRELFEAETLVSFIEDIAKNWGVYNEKIKALDLQIATASIDLENAQENAKSIDNQLVSKKKEAEIKRQNKADIQQERQALLEGKSIEVVENEQAQRHQSLQTNLAKARDTHGTLQAAVAKLGGELEQLRRKLAETEAAWQQKRDEISQWLAQHESVSREDLREFTNKSAEWIARERESLQTLKDNAVSAKATFEERSKQYAAHQLSENRPKETETAENQQVTKAELTKKIKEYQDLIISTSHKLTKDGEERVLLKEKTKACEKQEDISSKWLKLNELFGSASGDKFKLLAQKYTLDALLQYANIHLQSLTKRYRLQTISDTMALQIEDRDMLNEVRSVHTLSGGESFLLSLALALGLASLSTQVAQQMQIGSLFIDEGFGALDNESLQLVFDALGSLQMQGRKIGIISHISDMTEHIPVQIQLKKSGNGRSNIQIINKLQK